MLPLSLGSGVDPAPRVVVSAKLKRKPEPLDAMAILAAPAPAAQRLLAAASEGEGMPSRREQMARTPLGTVPLPGRASALACHPTATHIIVGLMEGGLIVLGPEAVAPCLEPEC